MAFTNSRASSISNRTRSLTSMRPNDRKSMTQKNNRNLRHEQRNRKKYIRLRKKALTDYLTKVKKDDEKIIEIRKTILSPEVQLLIRQRSTGMSTRHSLGTTSCRHLQMLFLLYEMANCIANIITRPLEVRQLLSQLWHGAIDSNHELQQFYSYNKVGSIHFNILNNDNFLSVFDGRCIFPMGLITEYKDGFGYRIFHYFILLKEEERYFIYNANGSDTIRAHPRKIEITMDEFLIFINHVNDFDQPNMDLFILTYFMEGATTPFYFDEGCNRTTFMDINKGKKIELTHYKRFSVAYFPNLRSQLIEEAVKKFNIDNPTFPIQQINQCMEKIQMNDCVQPNFEYDPPKSVEYQENSPLSLPPPPQEGSEVPPPPNKHGGDKGKKRTNKNKRLK